MTSDMLRVSQEVSIVVDVEGTDIRVSVLGSDSNTAVLSDDTAQGLQEMLARARALARAVEGGKWESVGSASSPRSHYRYTGRNPYVWALLSVSGDYWTMIFDADGRTHYENFHASSTTEAQAFVVARMALLGVIM